MIRRALVALLALAFAGVACADARQELHAAFARNVALKSFKATMVDLSSNKTVSVVEFQAPDRFRVTPTGMPPRTRPRSGDSRPSSRSCSAPPPPRCLAW